MIRAADLRFKSTVLQGVSYFFHTLLFQRRVNAALNFESVKVIAKISLRLFVYNLCVIASLSHES